MSLASRGIDVRQTGQPLLFDAAFINATTGAPVTAGTATAQLFECQSDGTLKPFDFSLSPPVFLATGATPATATIALTSQGTGSGPTLVGIWSGVLANVTGLTAGGIYYMTFNVPAGAAPYAPRKIQYGLAEGDISVTTAGLITDINSASVNTKVTAINSAVILSQVNGIITGTPTQVLLTVGTLTVGGITDTPPTGSLAGMQCIVQDVATGAIKGRVTITTDAGTITRTLGFAAPGFAVAPNATDTVSIA
jgi:hypothetical protein